MRARWLKPEFFTDKKIGQLDPVTALVYQALWCWADDGGTAQADPSKSSKPRRSTGGVR